MADNALTGKVPARKRDPRLDFFRGLALVMIYINHIPGQFYENLTSRNFGFSDAAEGFVFMSGTAAAIAYGPRLKDGLNVPTLRKMWGRAWQLYIVHLFITVCVLAIFSAFILYFGTNELLLKNGMGTLMKMPLEFFLGTVSLTNQLSYVNILPLYSVLMLGAPFAILLAQRKPLVAISCSVAIWAIAGYFKLNFPTFPNAGGWFLNPFSWQLIFMIGIFTGLAMRAEKRLVPLHWTWISASLIIVIFAAADQNARFLQVIVANTVMALKDAGAPTFLVDFVKPYVGGPRLLHLLALVYVLSLPWGVPAVAASRLTQPIRMMGKHSLPVFALGTILSIAGQAIKTEVDTTFVQDTLMIVGGLALLYSFALSREWLANKDRQAAATPAKPVEKAVELDLPNDGKVVRLEPKVAS